MLKLAVVGADVSHSASPAMHTFLLAQMGERCTYDRISVPPARFDDAAAALLAEYDGFNVTMPYKQSVLPHLRRLHENAAAVGAVNTVLAKERVGFNTDGDGFGAMLRDAGISLAGARVLVLGAGGAGRACIRCLTAAGAAVFVHTRDAHRLRQAHDLLGGFTPLFTVPLQDYAVIVNCTGAGMLGDELPSVRTEEGLRPVGAALLSRCGTAVDLIYEPKMSAFLRVAQACGARTLNGRAMLFYQAYYADCIYLDKTPSAAQAQALWAQYREENP